ncbi:BZ3501_MvSof-1269-A2-R1_Chr3-2g06041 [Microbotryum saponariae]|nr:BZ3501_MvSof-1269-A2-R1_Chr3-2g06041 [Microbotryum saponariae]
MLMHGPNVLGMVALASLLLPTVVFADQPAAEDCIGTITKESDVTGALKCKDIRLGSLTITSGKVLALDVRPGAKVTMYGDILFDNYKGQKGAMMYIKGQGITVQGNNHKILANGQKHWPKTTGKIPYDVPTPVMLFLASGSVQNLAVVNSPRQAISINNPGPLTVSNVNVDNSAGEGRAVNTDGMDIRANGPLEVTGCTFTCQDDSIAISGGDQININHNICIGGHGISIGSVRDGDKITNTRIAFNTLHQSVNGLRIKTMKDAQNALVDGVTYEGNKGTGIKRFGFVLQQNYTNDNGQGQAPTSGVVVKNVYFADGNQFTLDQAAISMVAVCGQHCPTNQMGLDRIKFIGGRQSEAYGYIPESMQAELSLIQRVTPQTKSTPAWSPAQGQTGSQQTKPSGGAQSAGTKKSGQSGSHSSSSSSSHQHSASSASSHQHRHHGPGHSGISGAPSLAAVQQQQGIKRQRKVNHHHRKHHHGHPSHRE